MPTPFGPDQADHLLNLFQQRLGRILKQEMRLIEEENKGVSPCPTKIPGVPVIFGAPS